MKSLVFIYVLYIRCVILAKSWDLFLWRTVDILLQTVKIFIMTGLELLFASAKIPERHESISPSSFYGKLPRLLVARVSLVYLVDESFSW